MKFYLVALSALLTATAFAGCASDPDDADDHMDGGDHMDGDGDHMSGNGTMNMTGMEDVVINVTAGSPIELRYNATRIEVVEGQRVGIVLSNQGLSEHEFGISEVGFHLHTEAGESAEGAFIAPDAGEYEIACHVSGHYEAGMVATLVVTPHDAMMDS